MAAHPAIAAQVDEVWGLLVALVGRLRTSWRKEAPGPGRLPITDVMRLIRPEGLQIGDDRDERTRVGMPTVLYQIFRLTALDDLTSIHYGHARAHDPGNGPIVGNENE